MIWCQFLITLSSRDQKQRTDPWKMTPPVDVQLHFFLSHSPERRYRLLDGAPKFSGFDRSFCGHLRQFRLSCTTSLQNPHERWIKTKDDVLGIIFHGKCHSEFSLLLIPSRLFKSDTFLVAMTPKWNSRKILPWHIEPPFCFVQKKFVNTNGCVDPDCLFLVISIFKICAAHFTIVGYDKPMGLSWSNDRLSRLYPWDGRDIHSIFIFHFRGAYLPTRTPSPLPTYVTLPPPSSIYWS